MLKLEIVSAEELLYEEEVDFVVLPGECGELGIYPRHTPLITRIKPGAIRIERQGEEDQFVFVSGGILEVQPGCVTVLADSATRAKDLDEAKINEAKLAAQESLANRDANIDYAAAQKELLIALSQLKTLQKLRR